MAERISARLTSAQGRRFGLTVGGAFLAIAGLMWWRGHPSAATVLSLVGCGLSLAGLTIPTRLGAVDRAWMALAHAISRVTTPILMAVIFLLVLAPIAWLRRTIGGNPLVHATAAQSYWKPRAAGNRRSKSLKHQF
jgi:hypothetical protein